MFDLGFWELLFIGAIALVVLGPERLPVAARTLGRWVGQARAYTRSLSNELNREVQLREMRDRVRSAESEIRSEVDKAGRSMRELAEATPADAVPEPAPAEPSATPAVAQAASPAPAPAYTPRPVPPVGGVVVDPVADAGVVPPRAVPPQPGGTGEPRP
ncbi:Sec-independent protein translocase protein TatB [Algiphilus sp.]|uniref:Sec-independent protein translocase protein TatB n=1 Tax=Algiphilus sp. TaxID=1872431 RepID=UPI0025BBD48D|nr:Sec-independent protein translocase protein TatB [Algiphilus sp.]MCK5770016.1 twin-arginine translocase subunit TatB [Algiphilus sp.]